MHAQSVAKSPPEAIWAAASSTEYGPKCWPSLLTVICMVNIAGFWSALGEWPSKVKRLHATALASDGESELVWYLYVSFATTCQVGACP